MTQTFEQIAQDPSAHYDSPEALIKDDKWSNNEKIQLLEQWEYDAKEMEVAAGENMGDDRPGEQSPLAAIQDALRALKEKLN